MEKRQSSEAAVVVSGGPSTSRQNRAPSLANEKGKGVMVEDYESESYIDPEDMRMFEEGFTQTVVRAEGHSRILEILLDLNLLQDIVDLVPQLDLLCSAAENGALQDVSDTELSRGVAMMGLRVSTFLFSLLCDLCLY